MKMAEIQTWLLNHAEKVVLGGVGLLIVVFLYMGYTQEGLNSDPAALKREVELTKQHIDSSTWKDEAPARLPVADNVKEEVKKGISHITYSPYETYSPWSMPLVRPLNKRKDPTLSAPIDLEAHAGSGPVAYIRSAEGVAQPVVKQRQSRKDRRRKQLESLGVKFDKDGKPLPINPAQPNAPIILTSSPIPGHRPSNMVEPRGLRFVAVTARVPNLKQREEYEAVFKDAVGYDPKRDTPRYIWYVVQRAEAVDPNAPVNWDAPNVKKFTSKNLQGATLNWDSVLDDPVPDKYYDPLLTSNAIPLMLREAEPFWMHSKVEREKLVDDVIAPVVQPDKVPKGPVDSSEGPDGPPVPGVGPGGPGVGPRGPGGVQPPFVGGERGGPRQPRGPGMEGVGGPGMAGETPPEFLLLRFYDTSVETGKYYRYRVRLWLEDPNDPYRGQVAAVGGNAGPPLLINEAWLDAEAAKRLKEKAAKDAKETPAGAPPKHTYWRETDWSQPTPPVILDREFHVLAGPVKAAKDVDRQRHLEAGGMALVSIFDVVRGGGDVTSEYAINRSSQINFQADGSMLNPVTLEVQKQPDYTFLTKHVVLDLHGGEPLPAWGKQANLAADKSPLAPGEILMLDERGQLRVRSEVDDFSDFDYYLYKPEAIAKRPVLQLQGGGGVGPGPIGPVGPAQPPKVFDFNQPGRGR